MSQSVTSKTAVKKLPEGSPYMVPAFLAVMLAISAVFYVQTARDDVDRYPVCFIQDCSQSKVN